ncbi:MAG TPA: methyltransferase domain-containing protein [Xanthobacteraceae bacterium]|nr:methyltransferase domain-containing protein [Xanthobacteraceae bacterium]
MAAHVFQSSGDLTADRRYEFARDLAARGDLAAAADLFAQAVELAPNFAAGWFALGEAQEERGEKAEAIIAFQKALTLDAADIHGAQLHLARLGAEPPGEMSAAYVREVFDQYAPRFDEALTKGLNYRGPELLLAAVASACATNGGMHFGSAIDLGCGTGLGGAAFRPFCERLTGVDLSPKMIAAARSKQIYDTLAVGDIVEFLAQENTDSVNLVLAADVFAYFRDLGTILAACAKVMQQGGMLAFSAETHDGDGVILGDKLRFAHGEHYVRNAIKVAGLTVVSLTSASTRNEAGVPVSGLIVVARRERADAP